MLMMGRRISSIGSLCGMVQFALGRSAHDHLGRGGVLNSALVTAAKPVGTWPSILFFMYSFATFVRLQPFYGPVFDVEAW
jgi:hypothetical protein